MPATTHMTYLKQRRYFETREYKILENEIHVKFKKSYEQTEWTIPFEELGFKKVYQSNPRTLNNLILIGIGILLAVMTVAYIYSEEPMDRETFYINWILWSLLATIFFFVGKKNEVFLTGGVQNLSFFRNKPNELVVDAFVEEVIRKVREHLRSKYAKVDEDFPEDVQLSTFYRLRNMGVITEEEYEKLKDELKIHKLF